MALCRFGVWRAAVAAIGAAVVATLSAWAVSSPSGPASTWIVAAAVVGGLCALGVCISLWRPTAGTLRWDGVSWSFSPLHPASEPIVGRLAASVDFDAFILLRFTPLASGGVRRRAVWLPAQRRGLEREWHAFRCAVHAPRPLVGTDVPAP